MIKSATPLVTVAVASYNNEKYIEETLDSVNAQTYDNIELIIIDDCSTDNSVVVIEDWLKKCRYPYQFVKLETNGGIPKMANHLLSHSSNNALYYSILASDDTILPDKIASQVQILNASDEKVGMVYTDCYVMDESSKQKLGTYMGSFNKSDYEYPPEGNVIKEMTHWPFFLTQTALYKKAVFDVVGKYDEALAFEDWDMSLRIAEKFEIIFYPRILANYRVHKNNFSAKQKDRNVWLYPFYIKHAKSDGLRERAETALMDIYLNGNPIIKEYLTMYEINVRKKYAYDWYMRNGLPVILIKAIRRFNNIYRYLKKVR